MVNQRKQVFSGRHAASDIVLVLACGREMIAIMKSWQRTLYLLEEQGHFVCLNVSVTIIF